MFNIREFNKRNIYGKSFYSSFGLFTQMYVHLYKSLSTHPPPLNHTNIYPPTNDTATTKSGWMKELITKMKRIFWSSLLLIDKERNLQEGWKIRSQLGFEKLI